MITKNQANIRLTNKQQDMVNMLKLSPSEIFELGLNVAVAQRNPDKLRKQRMKEIRNDIMVLEAEFEQLENHSQDVAEKEEQRKVVAERLEKKKKLIFKNLKSAREAIEDDEKWDSVLRTNFRILIEEGWKGSIVELEKIVTGVISD